MPTYREAYIGIALDLEAVWNDGGSLGQEMLASMS